MSLNDQFNSVALQNFQHDVNEGHKKRPDILEEELLGWKK